MTLLGISSTLNSSGQKVATLYVAEDFPDYYHSIENGRTCSGKMANGVYVGMYDISALKVGMEIDILYDKAITSSKGTFQQVKRIDIIK